MSKPPTSDKHFGRGFAGADVIGSHTLVRAAVAHFYLGDGQQASTGCLRPQRESRPVHPAPLELDRVRAVGEALHVQGVACSQLPHVRHAGGVRRGCRQREQCGGQRETSHEVKKSS